MINSKVLFRELVQNLTIETAVTEKEAIVYLMLEHQCSISRTDVLREKEVATDPSSFNSLISRLNKNEPIQYVLGEAYFYGRIFFVDPSVLIPRPETEFIIQLVKDRISKSKKNISILDVGTGSGCIAVTLALEIQSATVFATDISKDALEIAKRNAQALRSAVNFRLHDILNIDLDLGPLDVIVSNPPYISENERMLMEKNVVEYEPSLALFVPDTDPLIFYKALARQAASFLKSGGYLVTEINERFGKETCTIFTNNSLVDAEIIKDLDGKDRVVVARKM